MGKIGDLWVRLGLKSDNFKKGIKDSVDMLGGNGGNSGFLGVLKKCKVAAVATFAAIASAAYNMADKFAHHSQRFGDAWDNTMAKMKGAWNSFLTSLTDWDWDSFGKRIRKAMSAAGESQSAHDAEFEVENSLRIRRAQMQDELAQLEILMRDTKLSYDKRAEYAREYLKKVEPLYKDEIDFRKRLRESDIGEFLDNAGLGRTADNYKIVEKFFSEVAPDDALLGALAEYSKRNQGKKNSLSADGLRLVEDFLSDKDYRSAAAFAVIAQKYLANDDESAKKAVDAISGYYSAVAAFNEETRRIQNIAKMTGDNQGASILIGAMIGPDAIVEKYEKELKELKRIGKDTTTLTEAFQRDLVSALKIDAYNQDDLVESVMDDPDRLQKHYDKILSIMDKYGLDATALTDKYNVLMIQAEQELNEEFKASEEANRQAAHKSLEAYAALNNVDLDPLSTQLTQMTEATLWSVEKEETAIQRLKDVLSEFADAAIGGLSDAVQELTDQMFGLEEVNPGRVIQALLTPLADMAIREGEIVMAAGLGIEAVKKGLESLTGAPAIAAGAMLIAIGAAAKSGLAALANAGGRSTATTTYGSAGAGASNVQTIQTELTVYVTGRLSGNDILLSGKKTQSNNNR